MNNLDWDLILRVLGILAPILGAVITSVYAIRRQLVMEQAEKKKIITETESLSADVASKYIDAAGNLQDFYTELLEDIKNQLKEQKEIICKLEAKLELSAEENIQLKKLIKEMKEGIEILIEQIREFGEMPRYPKEE